MKKVPEIINRYLFNVVNAFHPHPPYPKKEKCVFTSRDEVAAIMRMCELDGVFIIRPYTYAGGETNYHVMQIT